MSEHTPDLGIKAPPCPNCGSTEVAAVLYSHPGCSEEIHLDLEENQGVIGGSCDQYQRPSEWCCTHCNHQFGTCSVTDEEE